MNVLFCIIHTQHQSDRYDNIVNTWAANSNYIFYSDHENSSQNIYKVSERSDYYSGQEKQINIFSLLSQNFNDYDWYVFCDNDTFINTSLLTKYIIENKFDKNQINGSIINYWPQDTSLYYPSGGAGFIMNRSVIDKLFFNELIIYSNLPFGDVGLGLNCRRLGISFNHIDQFKSQPPEYYNISEDSINQYLSFHYITKLDRMNELQELCIHQ